jgi:hypothetical protein
MENLIITGSHGEFDQPSVHFDVSSGICELSGESYLENTIEFYDRLMKWLDQYMAEVQGPVTFNFKLTYFNTSSSKKILHLMLKLKKYQDAGGKVTVSWHYNKDDIEMEEGIEDLGMIAKLDIIMVQDESLQYRR